ncbi:MAG: imidazole glycerol phosphate synthase subunit HisH [Pseudomonadota bacterium]
MTTVLVDYDSGNLHSAEKAFQRMAREGGHGAVAVTRDPDTVARANRIVLPGDGAFPACRRGLQAIDGLEEALRDAVETRGVPFLGICVGMQMMARLGREHEDVAGFGWIDGVVDRIAPDDPNLKIPHMGWNDLRMTQAHPVTAGIETGDHAYFVHGYHMQLADQTSCVATADYGGPITAIVANGTTFGAQFHPEKSQRAGLRLIANFLAWRP